MICEVVAAPLLLLLLLPSFPAAQASLCSAPRSRAAYKAGTAVNGSNKEKKRSAGSPCRPSLRAPCCAVRRSAGGCGGGARRGGEEGRGGRVRRAEKNNGFWQYIGEISSRSASRIYMYLAYYHAWHTQHTVTPRALPLSTQRRGHT